MKVLITYHSDTGNTKKVAQSMKDALEEEGQEVVLMPAKDVAPSNLNSYDLVCLGSGVYGGGFGKSGQAILKNAIDLPPKFALFCTHMDAKVSPKFFGRIKKIIEKGGATIIGEFECPGEDLGLPPDFKEKMLSNMPPERKPEAEKWFAALKGRPNDKDLEKAKEFAKSLIK